MSVGFEEVLQAHLDVALDIVAARNIVLCFVKQLVERRLLAGAVPYDFDALLEQRESFLLVSLINTLSGLVCHSAVSHQDLVPLSEVTFALMNLYLFFELE